MARWVAPSAAQALLVHMLVAHVSGVTGQAGTGPPTFYPVDAEHGAMYVLVGLVMLIAASGGVGGALMRKRRPG